VNKTKIEWTDYTWNPVTGCWGTAAMVQPVGTGKRRIVPYMATNRWERKGYDRGPRTKRNRI